MPIRIELDRANSHTAATLFYVKPLFRMILADVAIRNGVAPNDVIKSFDTACYPMRLTKPVMAVTSRRASFGVTAVRLWMVSFRR